MEKLEHLRRRIDALDSRLLYRIELEAIQPRVGTVALQELGVRPFLDDVSVVEHHDAVRVLDRG